MAEIIPKEAPDPRSLLGYDGTDFYVLKVDADGHLQIDALEVALPDGAATQTTLALCLTSLTLIDNLPAALRTVGANALIAAGTDSVGAHHDLRTDTSGRPIVRGEDQVFSYKQSLLSQNVAGLSGADGYLESKSPAAGLLWKVTNVRAVDLTTATTRHGYGVHRAPTTYDFAQTLKAMAAGENSHYHGEVWLEPGDKIRVYFIGGLGGDTCYIDLTGSVMTKET